VETGESHWPSEEVLMTPLMLLLIVAVLSILVLLMVLAVLQKRRRREGFAKVAHELGFSFAEKLDPLVESALRTIDLFAAGTDHKTANVMQGKSGSVTATVLDFTYMKNTAGQSGKPIYKVQTIAILWTDELELPRFSLHPEGLHDKVASALGQQDIDFDSHPRFSGRYHLTGGNEQAVRQLFSKEVLDYFEAHPGLWVETLHGHVVVYRRGKRVAPKAIRSFLALALEINTLLRG